MILQVYTPEKKIFEGKIQMATMPGSNGSFQIFNDHAHLISILNRGDIIYKDEVGIDQKFFLQDGGCVEVCNNTIKVLAW